KRSQFLTLQDSIKQGILWKTLDLLNDDPPAEGLHLIFLRNNILTYYSPPLLQPALKKVTESLELEGYLIIGAKEKLPGTATNMQPYSRYPQALIRRDRPWRVHNEE
ncbi:MAG: CheR family methyltransferase, partial [Desulforhabdus sp.]|nr:CheR family methyltransferase [Desulforhabdus sp.]